MKKSIAIIIVLAALLGGTHWYQVSYLDGIGAAVDGPTEKVLVQKKELTMNGGRVNVGGIEANFKPEVTMERWNGETNIKVWSDEVGDNRAEEVNGKVVWQTSDRKKEFRLYPVTEAESGVSGGGFEYEIILKEKPSTNVVRLNIETKDLLFYYQPALDQALLDPAAIRCDDTQCFNENNEVVVERPENVVGSYAVYHATKRDYIIGQTDYKTGKAFHIYRPKIIDANGKWIWGVMNIENGVLTITINQKFLDDAVYPVSVDPTLGQTEIGGTSGAFANNTIRTNTYTTTEAGTVDTVVIYSSSAQNVKFRGIIALNSDLSTITYGSEVSGTLPGNWSYLPVTTAGLAANTAYRIGAWIGIDFANLYYDSGLTLYRDSITYHATNPPPNPIVDDSSIADRKISIYAIYSSLGLPDSVGCFHLGGDWYINQECWIDTSTSTEGYIYLTETGSLNCIGNAVISAKGISGKRGTKTNAKQGCQFQFSK